MSKRLHIALILALALCLTATALAFVACSQTSHTHTFGQWIVVTPAACSKEGARTRSCSECGEVESEPIAALGHVWDDGVVTVEPTCEDEGKMIYTCIREGCGGIRTVKIDALGHDWQQETELKAATCTEKGAQVAVCARCNARENEQPIPELGHLWDNGQVLQTRDCENDGKTLYTCTRENCAETDIKTQSAFGHAWGSWQTVTAANCTAKGSEKRTCSRATCNKSETRATNALGHLWGNVIVDKYPTFDETGEQSRHCTRNGCNERDGIQTIPKLDASTPIEYTVKITDPCGDAYKGVATLEFVADGLDTKTIEMTAGGVTKITLGAANYQVKISNLTEGYFVNEAFYNLFASEPQLTVCLGASLINGSSTGAKYGIGSIMYDYLIMYYDKPDGELITSNLSTILKDKKGILLNFYFKGCMPCANEMPALVTVSNTFKDDIQILMVNDTAHGNSDDDVKYFHRTYGKDSSLWFLSIARSRFLYNYLYNGGLIGGFPTSIFIDCNGQVVYAHGSAMSVSGFTSAINTYILDRYDKCHKDTATTDVNVANHEYEALLPYEVKSYEE